MALLTLAACGRSSSKSTPTVSAPTTAAGVATSDNSEATQAATTAAMEATRTRPRPRPRTPRSQPLLPRATRRGHLRRHSGNAVRRRRRKRAKSASPGRKRDRSVRRLNHRVASPESSRLGRLAGGNCVDAEATTVSSGCIPPEATRSFFRLSPHPLRRPPRSS